MKERNSVTKETAVRYRNAKKKEKKQILDEYVKLTGFARKYAIAKLNSCIHKREHEYNNVTIKTVKVELPKKKNVNAGEKFPDFAGLKFPLSGKKIY